MSDRTEQEQIELFTRWWKTSGVQTLAAVALAVAAYIGWSQWQAHQHRRVEAASVIYQQLLEASGNSPARVQELAGQLRADYADTFYGQSALLFLAGEAVAAGDLAGAEKYLDDLIRAAQGDDLLYTARLRSAHILHALGKDDEALARLQEPVAKAFQGLFAELRGDIHLSRNEADKARAAYEEAKKADESGAGTQQQNLDMKLSQVGVGS